MPDRYLLNRASGDLTEAEQIVRKTAALIMAEIRETEYDTYLLSKQSLTEIYFTPERFTCTCIT